MNLAWSKLDFFKYFPNNSSDQTAWMNRLVCAFVVRMEQSQIFLASILILQWIIFVVAIMIKVKRMTIDVEIDLYSDY